MSVTRIIDIAKEIEYALEMDLKATGKGLHEKVDKVKDHLGAETVKKIRLIATIRNKAVHEKGYTPTPEDLELIESFLSGILGEIKSQRQTSQPVCDDSPKRISVLVWDHQQQGYDYDDEKTYEKAALQKTPPVSFDAPVIEFTKATHDRLLTFPEQYRGKRLFFKYWYPCHLRNNSWLQPTRPERDRSIFPTEMLQCVYPTQEMKELAFACATDPAATIYHIEGYLSISNGPKIQIIVDKIETLEDKERKERIARYLTWDPSQETETRKERDARYAEYSDPEAENEARSGSLHKNNNTSQTPGCGSVTLLLVIGVLLYYG